MNHDNLLSTITRVYVDKRTSKKTGNTYYVLCIRFGDIYTKESFIDEKDVALINVAVDQMSASRNPMSLAD